MSSDVSIKVSGLGKCFHIYNTPRDRLLQMFWRGRKQLYHEFWALRDVSFTIGKGECVGIVGRNGSGKSTLLQLICGTLSPTTGEVQAKGRIAALLELGSGFNPEFSGLENVYLNGALLGLERSEIDKRLDDILEFADIGDFVHQPVKNYSSGMMMRLAFAVQATVEPDILIVDEALAVGDEKFQRKCFARLESLKAKGTSILFVSHSGPQIIEFCDRAILIEQGSRVLTSTPMQVVRAYQKLIYAPAEDQRELINAYRLLDSGEEAKSVKPDDATTAEAVPVAPPQALDYFDKSLIPETTTYYPEQGARIESFRILDENDNVCNVLSVGREYRIVMSGSISSAVERCYLGMHIRSVSGAVITGQRYPEEGRFIEGREQGTNFSASYSLRIVMVPGIYFIGGGVWSASEPNCCHRILDALMFRVAAEERSYSFGYVDASTEAPNLQLF